MARAWIGQHILGTDRRYTQWLDELGLFTQVENDTTCCYARQDKFWVEGTPHGEMWEVYTPPSAFEAVLEAIKKAGIEPTESQIGKYAENNITVAVQSLSTGSLDGPVCIQTLCFAWCIKLH